MRKLIAAALVLITLPLAAQEAALSESVDVNIVLVDATVTDSSGNPILGLGPDDFIVSEEGTEVPVGSVDYFTSRRLVSSHAGEALPIDEVKEERWIVLFFHRYLGSRAHSDEMRARKDAIRWIEQEMLPTDRVAVIGHDVRMRVFADFTNDVDTLRDAVNATATTADGLRSKPSYVEGASLFDVLDYDEAKNETGRVFDSLELLAEAVRPIRARKVMILFSQGVGEDNLMTDDTWVRPAIAALNRSNVQVWTVQIPGLGNRSYEENLARIAIETGGEALRNPVNYAAALRNADKENAGYYLLSYRSPNPPAEGEYRDIEVSVRNPEFRVSARPGYGG